MIRKKKPSLQDQMEAYAGAMRGLCALNGKPMPPELEAPTRIVKPTRSAPVKSDPSTLEASVMTELAQVYHTHPNILFAVRQNSGSSQIGNSYVWFWKWMRRNSVEMTLVDTWGLLRDGRMFAIEAKRPGWKGVGTGDSEQAVKERRQQNFINVVKVGGGVGGFVTSGEQALAILAVVRK